MSFDELGRPLRDITFCVVDLETTGGSAQGGSMITEIGAVKVRGGEVLGEFQTLVNPHAADPAVHRGAHRHHQLDGGLRRRRSSRRCRRSSSSRRAASWSPTTRRSTSASSSTSRLQQERPWPGFEVLDTARLARRVITRDDAPNCKLSSLAIAFGSAHHAQPPGALRRPGDGRRAARPDGAARRPRRAHAGGAADLHLPRQPRRTPQAAPRRAPAALPRRLPLPRRAASGCSTSAPRRDLRTRVRSYFTASETPLADGRDGQPRGLGDRHRVRHPARGPGARAAADRGPQAALQPPQPPSGEDALAQAHRGAVAAAVPGPQGGRGRCRLPRARSPPAARPRSAWPRCTRPSRSGSAATGCAITPTRSPCVLAEMGRCLSPCDGSVSMDHYAALVADGPRQPAASAPTRWSRRSPPGWTGSPSDERFEEAGVHRDRLSAFVRAASRTQRLGSPLLVRRAGRCPARGRPPVGGARRTPRPAGRLRRDPPDAHAGVWVTAAARVRRDGG